MLLDMTHSNTPVVLVHGNPETDVVWDPFVAALGRDDVIRLSPPGFGAPLPDGFAGTVDAYRDWLVAELEAIGRPVDLVGHDWGGGHVVNVAMSRPDLLRSWATDAIGVFDPGYVWHPIAQTWQGPAGEQDITARFAGTRTRRTLAMIVRGMNDGRVASRIAAEQGPEMARAILGLYRSAVQPAMAERGRHLERAAARPGLCFLATADVAVGTHEQRRRSAARAGARVVTLDGLGHWWLLQDPAAGALALSRFWHGLNLLNDTQAVAA
jgi:pimeloyl-ACP methyl ester carboxylesterase